MKLTLARNKPFHSKANRFARTLSVPTGNLDIHDRSINTITQEFTPISLKQMDAVALLNRIDTKFVMTTSQLLSVLSKLPEAYWILSVHGQRLNHYFTLYFDTPDFELYRLHVNGRAERYKVRSREYTDTKLSFLEVKHKTRKGRTIKERILTEQPLAYINPETTLWLQNFVPFDSSQLEPKLSNTFTRVTLVNKGLNERVTLDINLAFHTKYKQVQMDGIAIAEVKMDTGNQHSLFSMQMREHRIYPQSFSKYCAGVALLYDEVKKNTMKAKLLKLEKLTRGVSFYE